MIKTIAYFPLQCARNAQKPLDAFLDSCQARGLTLQENSLTSDAVVIWSVLWNGRMQANEAVYNHYRRQNKPVIVMDVGALYRGHTWKLAVNNINALGYYGHQDNLDWNRPKRLGLSLGYSHIGNPGIVIAAQHNRSLQVKDLQSIEDWINQQIVKIKQYSDRPIIIRPHPRSALDVKKLPSNVHIEIPEKIALTYDDFNMKFDYHALVNYNSGPGIQGAIEGCPVIVDKTSLASPVSIDYKDLENIPAIDRERWFVEICHTEYTVEELEKGLWLKRIEPALCLN